jgi:hypothetical protein
MTTTTQDIPTTAVTIVKFRQTLLDAAGLDDADLTDDLEPIVDWLVGWDRHTVDAVAALLTATRKATP